MTIISGISMLMFSCAAMYGVGKGFDKMIGKELPIQTITLENWRNSHE